MRAPKCYRNYPLVQTGKDAGVCIIGCAQSKWGRHRCRPHSHRCVGKSEDKHLASDVSPSFFAEAKISGSVTGARTGIRIHPPAKSSRAIEAEAFSSRPVSTLNRRFRGRTSCAGPSSGCVSSGPKTFRDAPIGRRPDDPARERGYFASLSSSPLRQAEAVPMGFSSGAGQAPSRHPGLESSREIPAVRPSNPGRVSPRSDDLNVPLPLRFGKLSSLALSTVPRFRCGREWISHRFVAKPFRETICRAWPISGAAMH